MTSVLVLGAGGMAGSMMTSYLIKQGQQVTPMFRQDFDALKNDWPDISHFDYVINCIGLIKQKSSDDALLYTLNSEFPKKLSQKCKRLIHLSSDCVFSGNLPIGQAYNIKDVPDATDSYGRSKAEGESIENAMVLRTSIIGPSKDNSGLFEWFRSTQDSPVKGFSNHWWSGITTMELAKIVDSIIKDNLYANGLRQLASPPISKYLLLCQINEIFDLGKTIAIHKAAAPINRVLSPDMICRDIRTQLLDLKDFTHH